MADGDLWTKSQRQAWGFVQSAYDEGLSTTDSLSAYRAGGGKIRTSDWVTLWHREDEGSKAWDTLYQYGTGDTVPESMFERVDVNYKNKYTVSFSADVRREDGTIIHNMYRQVSSDERHTVGEYLDAIQESLSDDPSVFIEESIRITDIRFYERV